MLMASLQWIKGGLCSFGEEIQSSINSINEVILQTQKCAFSNKLFSEENKVLRTPFETRKVAGSGTLSK